LRSLAHVLGDSGNQFEYFGDAHQLFDLLCPAHSRSSAAGRRPCVTDYVCVAGELTCSTKLVSLTRGHMITLGLRDYVCLTTTNNPTPPARGENGFRLGGIDTVDLAPVGSDVPCSGSFMPLRLRLVFAPLMLAILAGGRAADAEWPDGNGATFRAEPVEALGPLLLFRAGPLSSRAVTMRLFSTNDCVRFQQAVAGRAPRATRWTEATGAASREFIGKLQWFNPWLGPQRAFDFASAPEPELLLVLFGGRWLGLLLDDLAPFITRAERVYPGRVATVVLLQRAEQPSALRGPPDYAGELPGSHIWLVASPENQSALKIVSRFGPKEPTDGFAAVMMTRQGVPLFAGPLNTAGEVMSFVDGASDLLWQLNPANPRSAADRLHYLRAVRPVEFARSTAEPLLLIDPFRHDVLRQRGIARVEAKLGIAADGAVTDVELLPASEMPVSLTGLVIETLRRNAVYLPAIARGATVPGSSHYVLNVEPLNPQLAADAAWIKGEARVDVPLPSWLVLKPVRVGEKVFSTVERIAADGTVVLKPVTAGRSDGTSRRAETNAFVSDWFAPEGPASVRPREGDPQEVDGEKLVWRRMVSAGGFVNLLPRPGDRSHDFCIGYAWTEFEAPEDTDAWLGIGSDDGLRVWFNGELVDDKWLTRRSRLDDDVVAVRLKKGRNQILVKVQNHTKDWSFTCRLRMRGN
jgi:hypothetical protein